MSLSTDRFLMIDGLRGIAAMMVVGYHLFGNLKNSVSSWLPEIISLALSKGNLGVQIFFVISGFVIACSIGDKHVNLKFLGKFALKRSIRLDPAYWVNIIVAILLIYLSNILFPELHYELPSIEKIISHIFYMQDLLGYGNIVAVYWTLCLEVQFYLLYVILLGSLQAILSCSSTRMLLHNVWVKWLFMTLGLLSIANYTSIFTIEIKHTFLPYWHNFFLGILLSWVIRGWINKNYFHLFWLTIILLSLNSDYVLNAIVTIVTATTVYIAAERNKLTTLLASAPYQYLGRISYSLYLIHPVIGWRIISVGKKYIGNDLSVIEGTSLFTAGVIGSVIASHIMFELIEKPSHMFSKNIK